MTTTVPYKKGTGNKTNIPPRCRTENIERKIHHKGSVPIQTVMKELLRRPSHAKKKSGCDSDVESWLYSLHLKNPKKYIDIFAHHEVNIRSLKLLNEYDLKTMGVTAVGALSAMLFAIKELREEDFKPVATSKNNDTFIVDSQTSKKVEQLGVADEKSSLVKGRHQFIRKMKGTARQDKEFVEDEFRKRKKLLLAKKACKQVIEQKDISKEPSITKKETVDDRLHNLELQVKSLINSTNVNTMPTLEAINRLHTQLERIKMQVYSQADYVAQDLPVQEGQTSRTRDRKSLLVASCKKALLGEIERQKEESVNEIRLLEEEISKVKFCDARTSEIEPGDIYYSQSDLIGEGCFSKVFKGCMQGANIAVKQLKISLSVHDKGYFFEEVNLLKDIQHPRVVLLLGVCTKSMREPLLIMEYISQGSLYCHIQDKERSISETDILSISRDIALGMCHLHKHKPTILHLNLKSRNVLIGTSGRAKVSDFGFSKLRYDAESDSRKTAVNPVSWMAPELLASGDITVKADVYSFAVVLWEMVAREHPHVGLSMFQIIERVKLGQRPVVPSTCNSTIADLVKKCWDSTPHKRPNFKDLLPLLHMPVG